MIRPDRLLQARLSRRRLLALGSCCAAGLLFPPVAAQARARERRELSFRNLHTEERLTAVYWERGAYVPEALAAIDLVLRDHRTGEVRPIAPSLLDLLAGVQGTLGGRGEYEVISGYRSPETNAMLHANDPAGVALGSRHVAGEAIDVCLSGRSLRRVRDAARSIGLGGVGYYPGRFVHLDVGPPRSW